MAILAGICANAQNLLEANYLNGRCLVRLERYSAHFKYFYYSYEYKRLSNIVSRKEEMILNGRMSSTSTSCDIDK